MMIEDKSTYAYQLRHLANPSFEKIRNMAKDFIMKLPEQLKDELYEEIERGEKQLETEPELMYYLHAFGKMHKAKLNYAFEHLPETFFEIPEINIIDYGCGQAVATMCYADFLRKQGYEQKIRRVTLIEPSEAALKRAALHVSVFFPDAEIVTINKGFDDLETKDIVCDEDVPTLHLLSNVLDLECFSLIAFKKLVKKRIGPSNLFVCVGPYFGDKDRGKRLDSFAQSMKGEEIFSEDLDAYELDEDNSWTCMVRCFGMGILDHSVSDEKLSTVVKAEDFWNGNGIKDKFGVVYSKDGKRLVSAEHCDCKTYTIKKGVKVICNKAFFECKHIQSINIPDSVTSIGDYAFEGCESLQSITIPNNVTSIGINPFANNCIITVICHSNCFKISGNALYDKKKKLLLSCFSKDNEFVIPDSVINIGVSAFSHCKSLTSIVIPDSVISIGDRAFEECDSLQSIIIPSSVARIGNSAFRLCKSLTSITIPNSVTDIGIWAFSYCKSLTSINIPNSVTSIRNSTFQGCGSIRSIIIPDSVTSIGDRAFKGCESLQSIIIPNSVASIGYSIFSSCNKLTCILVEPKNEVYDSRNNCNAIIEKNNNMLLTGCSKTIIPESVTSISKLAFESCESLISIIIPNNVVSIGDGAFCECMHLQYINIPDSVTNVGDYAFEGCESLQSIIISNKVTIIGQDTFESCKSLQTIVIPNSVRSIEDSAFRHCKSLTSITIPDGVMSIKFRAFGDCESLKAITLPNSMASISDYAFEHCKSLQTIIFLNSSTSIKYNAFWGCESLRTIIIPNGSRKKFEKLLPNDVDKLVER